MSLFTYPPDQRSVYLDPRAERAYFKQHLKPHIDGDKVELIREVNDEKKQPFLAQAAALLFPIDWPEPFGLVVIEAMACGTPVIAYKAGSVPEIIEDGVTGFIVNNEEEAIHAVKELSRLDRRKVRAGFEAGFRRSEWHESTRASTESWPQRLLTAARSPPPRPQGSIPMISRHSGLGELSFGGDGNLSDLGLCSNQFSFLSKSSRSSWLNCHGNQSRPSRSIQYLATGDRS